MAFVRKFRYGRSHRKICRFCKNNQQEVDYKDIKLLTRYISDRGKILPRRISGNCAKHQRKVAAAVKKARNIALLPFIGE